ncbi:MAG: reverse transcriptase family protein, partial [Candidatus Neomarinimicrobiota bacterium]
FSVFSLNSQSINAKFDNIQILLHILKSQGCFFSAICIQESWLNESSGTGDLELEHYDYHPLINQPLRISQHAGLLIYLHKTFRFKPLPTPEHENWENQFIEIISDNRKNIILGNIYRLPIYNDKIVKDFTKEFTQVLDSFKQKNAHYIVCGDTNIDLLKFAENNDNNICTFIDSIISLGFVPKITHPTRFSPQHGSSSLIDNAFMKTSLELRHQCSGILTSKISDHLGYFVSLDEPSYIRPTPPPKYIYSNAHSPEKVEDFRRELIAANIIGKLDQLDTCDANQKYNTVAEILENARKEHLPLKKVKFNKRKHGKSNWITQGIIQSINFRDKLYKKFINTPITSMSYFMYKVQLDTFNKILKSTIRAAKQVYLRQVFEKCKNDMKKTWKSINYVLNRHKHISQLPETFMIKNSPISNKQIIADSFNDYFIGIGEKLAENLETSNLNFEQYLKAKPSTTFSFTPIDCDEISNIIDGLKVKTSYGHDFISTKLLKSIKSEICEALTLIVNQSLVDGNFPDLLKIAKVTPIFKKGDSSNIENYRPISVLPAISKVFETVIYRQLFNYFTINNLFSNSQYGFRKSHSTEHASIELIDRILEFMQGDDVPFSIFIDLSKAFDTINHGILLRKLQFYGLDQSSLRLFNSYLVNRQQYVTIDGIQSKLGHITTGVPQGSILGPLLFIIYINDISNSSSVFNIISYADDTTLTSSLKTFNTDSNVSNISHKINSEVGKVSEWLCANKLSLNLEKTKFMVFHKPQKQVQNLDLRIMDNPIDRVENFTFLGLTLDYQLNWKTHIMKTSAKISKVIGIMSRLKHTLPSEILSMIYNSLILPHINYSLLSWGFGNIDRIRKLQKKAARIITLSKYNAHTMPLFKSLHIMTIEDIFIRSQLKFYFQFCHGSLPVYMQSFNFSSNDHLHNTRFKSDIHILGKDYTK